jgi:hypothetical protein
MSYRIAGIDVHKKMLAVVVADVEVQGEYQFERIRYGSNPEQLSSPLVLALHPALLHSSGPLSHNALT